MKPNVLVAQSGGPSPVINASLYGVIDACRAYPDRVGRVYAAWHGIEGVLCEELIDMTAQDAKEIELLKYTPSAGAIGTCRYKLEQAGSPDYLRILEVFRAHNIGYFFYIGGNDSMDTAKKVSDLAASMGMDIVVCGIPKTIDNDVGDSEFKILDHTPGYGSTARYWAYLLQNAEEENRAIGGSECVQVYQAMGRRAGFITAASRLGDLQRKSPLLLFFAETNFNLAQLYEKVNAQLSKTGRCVVVVNEGFDISGVGDTGERRDGFGHTEYGASGVPAAQAVVNYLNARKLNAHGQATGQIPGVIQRSTALFASKTDIEEAAGVAAHAVRIAMEEGGGFMATIVRKPGSAYTAAFDKALLEVVAGSERLLPRSWITADGTDVTDDFVRYALPLIGDGTPDIRIENGLQRFSRITRTFIDKKLPAYTPEKF